MKKLLVLMLVLGVASLASAGLTWSSGSATVVEGSGDVVNVNLVGTDIAGSYSVDATSIPVASITITALPLAGDNSSVYQYPVGHMYEGYIWLQVLDSAEPFNSGPGNQFGVAIDTTGLLAGTYMVYADIYGDNDPFTLNVIVPEPITMGLLAVGGLFLRRRK